MKLTLLGTSHGVPSAVRYTSCYMLEVNEKIYIFDGGAPIFDLLLRKNKAPKHVKAFFNSHFHGDHIFGALGMLSLFEWYCKETSVDAFLPDEKSKDALINIISAVDNVHLPSEKVRIKTYEEGIIFDDGTVRVSAIPVNHPCGEGKKSYAFLIEAEGKKIVFTGDMSPTLEDFPKIAKDGFVDAVISEAAHSKLETFVDCIKEVNTNLFIVSHIFPESKIEKLEAIKNEFKFELHIACDNDEFVL